MKTRTIADSLRGYSLDELRRMARANGGTPNDGKARRRHGPYKRRPYVPPQEESRRATWGDPSWGSSRSRAGEAEPKRSEHKGTPHSAGDHRGTGSRHHRILGVRPGATRDEIRSAYRALAMQHHPDDGGSVERMREINLAYARIGGRS
jgi:DnaJ-domain-containing protein 1